MSGLPSPLDLAALGGLLCVAGGASFYFAPAMFKLSAILAGAGGVLLLVSGAAFGYERMGEAKLQPKLDAALNRAETAEGLLEKQRQYAAELDQKAKNAATDSEAAYELYLKEHADNEKLTRAQRAAIPADVASMRIPESVISLLDGIPATSLNTGSKVPAGPSGVVASGPRTAAADSTLGAVADWGIACRAQYDLATKQVNGWIDYFNKLFPPT